MTKELWLNLPVKDVKRSRKFFEAIGWKFNDNFGSSEVSECLVIGEKQIAVMLFQEEQLKKFAQTNIIDTSKGVETLISFDLPSKKEVDELAEKVRAAGGILFGEPEEIDGWMYGFGFIDPDGHRWNGLSMDMSKIPGTKKAE